jgi:hypothetical protein
MGQQHKPRLKRMRLKRRKDRLKARTSDARKAAAAKS